MVFFGDEGGEVVWLRSVIVVSFIYYFRWVVVILEMIFCIFVRGENY